MRKFAVTPIFILFVLALGSSALAQKMPCDPCSPPAPQVQQVPLSPQFNKPIVSSLNSDGSQSETTRFVRDASGNIIEQTTTRSGGAADSEGGLPPRCAEPAEKAQSLCTAGDSGTNAQMQSAIQMATQMMASGGTEKACKAASTVQMLAGMANGAHAMLCQKAISSCDSACVPEWNRLMSESRGVPTPATRATERAIKMCRGLKKNVIASGMAAMGNIVAFGMSQKCQKALTNTAATGTPPAPYDCTNPMMSGSPQCVCAANPADPVCSGSTAGLGDGATFGSVTDGSAVDGGVKDLESIDFEDEIGKQDPSNQASGGSTGGGGGGGGGMSGGGGAGALPPEETGGAGTGPYNTDIMGGLTGGGGSGGGSYGSGGGGGGSEGGGSMLDSLAEKFNLKAFLPSKADFKNRGLASGNGADGITGPNGPSLFEKVSSRYHKKQSELLP